MGFSVHHSDCLDLLSSLKDGSADLVLTSPPYNIGKDYEKNSHRTLNEYLEWQGKIIQEAARVCSHHGSICWQVGNYIDEGAVYPLDCMLFNSFISQNLMPRNRIVWTFNHGLHCKKRFSGRHETILWFSRSNDYIFNLDPVRVPQKYKNKKHFKGPKKGQLSCNPLGANPGDNWCIPSVKHNHPEKTKHPCQFPERLSDRLVLSLTNPGGLVVDPFMGSGTTGISAVKHGRDFAGCDKDLAFVEIANARYQRWVKTQQIEDVGSNSPGSG